MKNKNYYIFIVIVIILIIICATQTFVKNNHHFINQVVHYTKSLISKNKVYVKVIPKKPRIVISLTTSPTRITKLQPVIDSMMKQTIQPDKIYLNLPNVFKRDNTTFTLPLPEFITQNKSIYVHFCEDIGPATKILPVLSLEKDPDTILISIDDDINYPPQLIETFLGFSQDYPDACLTGTSYMLKENTNKMYSNTPEKLQGQEVELLEGYSGVLYKRKFFSEAVLKKLYKSINENKGCKFGDDFSISNALISEGIQIIMIGITFNAVAEIMPFEYGFQNDALHLGSSGKYNNQNYESCSNYLQQNGELVINYHKL